MGKIKRKCIVPTVTLPARDYLMECVSGWVGVDQGGRNPSMEERRVACNHLRLLRKRCIELIPHAELFLRDQCYLENFWLIKQKLDVGRYDLACDHLQEVLYCFSEHGAVDRRILIHISWVIGEGLGIEDTKGLLEKSILEAAFPAKRRKFFKRRAVKLSGSFGNY